MFLSAQVPEKYCLSLWKNFPTCLKNFPKPLESYVSRLDIYVFKLEICIFRLEMYISKLEIIDFKRFRWIFKAGWLFFCPPSKGRLADDGPAKQEKQ